VVQIKEVQIRITDASIDRGASASPAVRVPAAPKFTERYFRHVPADASGKKVRSSLPRVRYTWAMRMQWLLALPFVFTIGVFAESAAGLRWTAPAGWKTEGARPMRAATYVVAPATTDRTSAECAVYFFGPGQGGTVDANIDRWKGQFRDRAGKPAAAEVARRTSHGVAITTIDVAGEYSGMGGPMSREQSIASGYRLLGAIVEGPRGTIFVKFIGPANTVAANQKKFEQLLASFQPER
jgi:hypothetical protein